MNDDVISDDGFVLILHRLPQESPAFAAVNTTNRHRRTLDQTLDTRSHWIAVHARLQNILTCVLLNPDIIAPEFSLNPVLFFVNRFLQLYEIGGKADTTWYINSVSKTRAWAVDKIFKYCTCPAVRVTYTFHSPCKLMHLSFKSVCKNKEHKGVICNMTQELLVLSRFHS